MLSNFCNYYKMIISIDQESASTKTAIMTNIDEKDSPILKNDKCYKFLGVFINMKLDFKQQYAISSSKFN